MENNYYLAHHGIKGQKWGVRKEKASAMSKFKKWANTDWKDATTKQKIGAVSAGVGLGLVATGASFVAAANFIPNTMYGSMSVNILNAGKRFVTNYRAPIRVMPTTNRSHTGRVFRSGTRIVRSRI